MSKCLYIHIRDFRYTDNATYDKILEKCKPDNIIKVFFYNKEQINNKKYSSNTSVKFFTEKYSFSSDILFSILIIPIFISLN